MTKDDFVLISDPKFPKMFKKVSPNSNFPNCNQQKELEGGLILFEPNAVGFNPGLYMERFMSKLNPDTKYLITRPLRKSRYFNIHENPQVWYEKNKVGINLVTRMMPVLSEVVGVPRLKNAQLRPTSMKLLKRARSPVFDLSLIHI